MKISIGSDHAGFSLKQKLVDKLTREGHELVDVGTNSPESCDYPDFAAPVARDVASGKSDRGILICFTGVGMSIAANKVPGVRAALGTNEEDVRLVRAHNDANVLTLGARVANEAEVDRFVDIFLNTEFEGGRHARRLGKVTAIEETGLTGKAS